MLLLRVHNGNPTSNENSYLTCWHFFEHVSHGLPPSSLHFGVGIFVLSIDAAFHDDGNRSNDNTNTNSVEIESRANRCATTEDMNQIWLGYERYEMRFFQTGTWIW